MLSETNLFSVYSAAPPQQIPWQNQIGMAGPFALWCQGEVHERSVPLRKPHCLKTTEGVRHDTKERDIADHSVLTRISTDTPKITLYSRFNIQLYNIYIDYTKTIHHRVDKITVHRMVLCNMLPYIQENFLSTYIDYRILL